MTVFNSGPYPAAIIQVGWLQDLSSLSATNFPETYKKLLY